MWPAANKNSPPKNGIGEEAEKQILCNIKTVLFDLSLYFGITCTLMEH
jgi:hypothetical protein